MRIVILLGFPSSPCLPKPIAVWLRCMHSFAERGLGMLMAGEALGAPQLIQCTGFRLGAVWGVDMECPGHRGMESTAVL